MIGKYRITANLLEVDEEKRGLHITVITESSGNVAALRILQVETFMAIIKAMKDANTQAFYEAMARFADEDMDAANEWIREQLSDD